MRAMKALLLIILCATPIQIATAQSGAKQNAEAANPAERDGVIAGRIVNDVGQPVAGAPILIIKAGVKITSGIQMATADDEGNFKATGSKSRLLPNFHKCSGIRRRQDRFRARLSSPGRERHDQSDQRRGDRRARNRRLWRADGRRSRAGQ